MIHTSTIHQTQKFQITSECNNDIIK